MSKKPLLRIEKVAAGLAGFCVLLMMLIGGADILSTLVLHSPIPSAYEVTETLMVAAVFLALALSHRENKQIRVELITERLSPSVRRVFGLISELASLLVYALIFWFGWGAAWTSLVIGEYSSGLIKLPLWPAKMALAGGALLMCVACVDGIRSHASQSQRKSV